MRGVLCFIGGVLVGGALVLQLKESESSCCRRVGAGVRDEVVGAAGPLGGLAGWLYDRGNVGSVAGALLDLFGVPHDA